MSKYSYTLIEIKNTLTVWNFWCKEYFNIQSNTPNNWFNTSTGISSSNDHLREDNKTKMVTWWSKHMLRLSILVQFCWLFERNDANCSNFYPRMFSINKVCFPFPCVCVNLLPNFSYHTSTVGFPANQNRSRSKVHLSKQPLSHRISIHIYK